MILVEWWGAYIDWATSAAGLTILTSAVIPFIAILSAGVFAAVIARGGMSRLAMQQERERKAAVIAAGLAAGRRAVEWGSITLGEQNQIDRELAESFAHLRLIPAPGADLAAEWAHLKTRIIKQKAIASAVAAEAELRGLEDWLVLWHRRPRSAARHFAEDLETLRYSAPQAVDYRDAAADLGGILHRAA